MPNKYSFKNKKLQKEQNNSNPIKSLVSKEEDQKTISSYEAEFDSYNSLGTPKKYGPMSDGEYDWEEEYHSYSSFSYSSSRSRYTKTCDNGFCSEKIPDTEQYCYEHRFCQAHGCSNKRFIVAYCTEHGYSCSKSSC